MQERELARSIGTRAPVFFHRDPDSAGLPRALAGAAARGRANRTPVRPSSRRRHEVRRQSERSERSDLGAPSRARLNGRHGSGAHPPALTAAGSPTRARAKTAHSHPHESPKAEKEGGRGSTPPSPRADESFRY